MVIHPKLLLDVLLVRQRKESQMDHGQLSMVADKFQWVFSETLLNTCGKDTKLLSSIFAAPGDFGVPRILTERDVAGFRDRLCEVATDIYVEKGLLDGGE